MGSQTPSARPKKSSSSSAHLYFKNGVYYYRIRFSNKILPDLPQREVRVSLRTAYKKKAIYMARMINEKFSDVTSQMTAPGSDGMTNEEKMAFIRNDIKKFVEELLAEPNKDPVDMTEARLRMQGYLKYELDQSAANTDIIEASKIFPSMRGNISKIITMPE
ncbi:MAG: DUF6538 domain-containing protein, partial [Desulfovibrio sp.]